MDGKILQRIGESNEGMVFMKIIPLTVHSHVLHREIFFDQKYFCDEEIQSEFLYADLKAFFMEEKSSQQFYSILVLHPLKVKKEEHLVDLLCCWLGALIENI